MKNLTWVDRLATVGLRRLLASRRMADREDYFGRVGFTPAASSAECSSWDTFRAVRSGAVRSA
mgnify:CR=1 FL=1